MWEDPYQVDNNLGEGYCNPYNCRVAWSLGTEVCVDNNLGEGMQQLLRKHQLDPEKQEAVIQEWPTLTGYVIRGKEKEKLFLVFKVDNNLSSLGHVRK